MFNENAFRSFLRNLNRDALAMQSRFWHSMQWALLKAGWSNSDMFIHELGQRRYFCDREWISRGYGYEAT